MTTDAVQQAGAEPVARQVVPSKRSQQSRTSAKRGQRRMFPDRTASVRVPFSREFMEGPEWLRGPRPGETAVAPPLDAPALEVDQPAREVANAVSEAARPAPLEAAVPVTGRDVAATATRALLEIDAAIASLQAIRTHVLAGIAQVAIDDARGERLDPAVALRDQAAEIGLRQRRSDRTVESEMTQSMRQLERWPAAVDAWGRGRINRGHLRVIEEVGAPLQDPEARAAFEAALLPHAEQTTPGRLRAIARTELEKHLIEPLAARHAEARKQRSVSVTDLGDGMSMVQMVQPTVLAHGIFDRLTQMARAAGATDPRSCDELRADMAADLLLTGEPTGSAITGIRADVSVVIPVGVLLGDDGPSDGAGQSRHDRAVARLSNGAPIDPETARLLAGRTKLWTRIFTDPLTGHVVAADTYKPSRRLRALLRARDQHCRWPGCMAKAMRCDIDHTKPWAEGGRTVPENLAHLCRRHHVLKGAQLAGARRWKVEQIEPGVLAFTSPSGETYIDQPPRVGPVFVEREPAPAWGAVVDGAPPADAPF